MNDNRMKMILQEFDHLPSMPGVALKLIETIQKSVPDLREIARLISSDAALSAKVLKIINSPFYGLVNKITTVDQAIRLLGLNTVKNLSLSLILKTTFLKKGPGKLNLASLWRDSLVGAIAAQLMAERIKIFNLEDAFFLGLLGNIGSLTLAYLLPDQYSVVQSVMRIEKMGIQDAENQVFGFNHTDVGALLTQSWGLPATFHIPILHHHSSESLPENCDSNIRARTAILHLSSLYVELINGGNMLEVVGYAARFINSQGFQGLLDAAEVGKELIKQTKSMSPIFEIQFRDEGELESLLERAKQELLNIPMQMVSDIIEKNNELESLRQQANKDPMTQLNNYKAFCEVLEQEIDRAARYQHPLCLVLGDIDFFKSINDRFGHPAGDQVLKEVAQTMQKDLRTCDFIARYGGEEFAIILPQAQLKDALHVADRLRQKVKSLEISYDGRPIRVTMSFGVAGFNHSPPMSSSEMVKSTDVALYLAKKQGRDRSCCASEN